MLRGDGEAFIVRGRHDVLSAVPMPSWLSRDLVQQMVTRYKQFLIQEVTTMMTRKSSHNCSTAALQNLSL